MGFPRKEPSSSITKKLPWPNISFISACKGFLCPNCLQCNYTGRTHSRPLISNMGKWSWRSSLLGRVIHTPGEDIKKVHTEKKLYKSSPERKKNGKVLFLTTQILAWIYTRESPITDRADDTEETTSNRKTITNRHENNAREITEIRTEIFNSENKGH